MPMYFQSFSLTIAISLLSVLAIGGSAAAAGNQANPLIGKWVEAPDSPEKCRGDAELTMMEFTPNSMVGYSHDKPVFTMPMVYPPAIFEQFHIDGNVLTPKDQPDCPMVRK